MTDDLFRPTIDSVPADGDPPWRPYNIVYPAFFGGALAATVLGLVNGRRLGIPRQAMLLIAGAGLAAVVGRIVATNLLDSQIGARTLGAVAGVAVWGAIILVQKRPFRAFELRGAEPGRLVGPGLAATFGIGLFEYVAVHLLVNS